MPPSASFRKTTLVVPKNELKSVTLKRCSNSVADTCPDAAVPTEQCIIKTANAVNLEHAFIAAQNIWLGQIQFAADLVSWGKPISRSRCCRAGFFNKESRKPGNDFCLAGFPTHGFLVSLFPLFQFP